MDKREDLARVHRRQFLLAPHPVDLGPDWRHETLAGRYFHYDRDLPIARATDAEGADWVLLGRAIETDRSHSALDAIAGAKTSELSGLTHSWTGRWLLIGTDLILTDACGLLGCLYARDRMGALWISSSPALLAQHAFSNAPEIGDDRTLLHERGISWFPPPRTRYSGIRRLLPSQQLSLTSGEVRARPFLPAIDPSAPYEQTVDWLADALSNAMAGIRAATEGPLWLGLTAGYDSRLILALAKQRQIDIRPYTRLTPRMSVADRTLSPLLAHIAGYDHHGIADQPQGFDRQDLFRQHTAGHVSVGDATPFLAGVRSGLTGTTFGGHGFALASGFSNWHELPETMPSAIDATRQFMEKTGEPAGSPAAGGLTEWFDWVVQTPHDNLDWRDRLFLEQRQTGWLAAKEHVYDMDPLERFPILNCARIYARLLGIDKEKRVGSLIQKDLIESLSPELAAVPFNPPDCSFLLRAPHRVFQRRWFFMSRRLQRRFGRSPNDHSQSMPS